MDEATLQALRRAIDKSPVVTQCREELRTREAIAAARQGLYPGFRACRAVIAERERHLRELEPDVKPEA